MVQPALLAALLLASSSFAGGMAIGSAIGKGSSSSSSKVLKSLLHYRLDEARALALMNLADECATGGIVVTEFLPPMECSALLKSFPAGGSADSAACEAYGGSDLAERKRVAFFRTGGGGAVLSGDDAGKYFGLLDVQGSFEGGRLEAEVFRRELVRQGGVGAGGLGDVIVTGNKGCQVICDPLVQDALLSSVKSIGAVPVALARLTLGDVHTRAVGKAKELVLIEASTRADAVISGALAISRASAARLIGGGDVQVDYRPLSASSYSLRSGEVVSIKRYGRLTIGEISPTLKQKFRIAVTKILSA